MGTEARLHPPGASRRPRPRRRRLLRGGARLAFKDGDRCCQRVPPGLLRRRWLNHVFCLSAMSGAFQGLSQYIWNNTKEKKEEENTSKPRSASEKEGNQEEDLSYAGLLKDKINALTKENEMLQNMLQHNPWSDTVYEQTQPDFTTNVLITYENSVLRRMITDVKGINESKKLTESQKQRYSSLISVNEWFRMNDHPINDIIEKESLKSVQGYTRWLLPIVNAMKIMVGGGISLPIWYDFNKGLENKKQDIVKTQCYMKIHWWENPKRIETKNVIM